MASKGGYNGKILRVDLSNDDIQAQPLDDTLPERLFTEALPDGPCAGHKVSKEQFEQLLDDYYRIRSWDSDGRPKREILVKLGLED